MKEHQYTITVTWTGNTGEGTKHYRSYLRDHEIRITGKPVIPGSSDPHFRGDPHRHNPEEMLVSSLSTCHMLWFLHLASEAGVVVTAYEDQAAGTMSETPDGGGQFTSVTLHPVVTVQEEPMIPLVDALHHRAHELCFIARSVNFPVHHDPVTKL